MIEGARKSEKFKIVPIPSQQGLSAYQAMSKSSELLFNGYDIDWISIGIQSFVLVFIL